MSLQLSSYAMKSSSGPVLDINEDLVDINLVNNIFTIMDGFGGSGLGDAAVKYIKDQVLNYYSSSSSDPDSTLPYFFDSKYELELNVLMNSIYSTHKDFMKENSSKPVSLRAGTSFIFTMVTNSLLMLVSIGNCACFLRRDGFTTQIIKPNTLAIETPARHNDVALSLFPSNAFGLYEKLDLVISEVKIQKGDQVLLCTDGVYGQIAVNEMNYILSKNHLSNVEKAQELLDLSNIRGNWDNQSLIILNF